MLVCSIIVPTVSKGQIPLAISDAITNDQILRFVEKWRQAWQNKHLDQYIECYAANFQQGEKDLQAWRKHKEKLNRKYKTISVDVDNIQIDLQKNVANVLFQQTYRSDTYFDKGSKQLVLVFTDEKGWQILRESSIN